MKPEVKITPVLPPGAGVTAQLTEETSVPAATGGWTVQERPKRKGSTEWTSQNPYAMSLPIMFDGFAEDRSVEAEIEVLRRIMRVPLPPRNEPAVVKVEGPVPMTRLRWVIQDMAAGPEIRREDGQRIRANFVLSLVEYVPVDLLIQTKASPAAAAQQRAQTSGAPTSSKTYTVKAGDTLGGVAQWHLGDRNRWPEIAKLNGIRDPKRLQIGTVLRIP